MIFSGDQRGKAAAQAPIRIDRALQASGGGNKFTSESKDGRDAAMREKSGAGEVECQDDIEVVPAFDEATRISTIA